MAFGLVKKAYQSMTWPERFQRSIFLSNLDHQSPAICLFESKQFVHCVVKRWQYIVVTSLDNETATKKEKFTMGGDHFSFRIPMFSRDISLYTDCGVFAGCWAVSRQEHLGFLQPTRFPIIYAGCNRGNSFTTKAANDSHQAFHMYIKNLVVSSMYSLLNYFLPFYEI